ncbi:MAG: hypothetical protein IKY85_00310 [Bacteroidaceae bacterium]|nr:hypothetical protein [Bacteroidaceae bacterium]
MTKLKTPTFIPEIFEHILGDSFHEIKEWLENGEHCYLGKDAHLENCNCEKSEDIKGFDVPVLIQNDEVKKKKLMIIVGESPLRNGTEKGLLVDFPFAVDYKNEPPQCAVYKKLFNELLKDYDLYITDIIKVWKKNEKLTVGENDRDILDEELEILRGMYDDIHILLMGSNAKKWDIDYDNCIEIPHMSRQNWNTWRIKIYEDVFRKLINDGKITKEDIEDLLVKDTNELEFCSMKADTVANTAFEMISSELEKRLSNTTVTVVKTTILL